jgi:quercetin dioxygenase-like cupin family protein
VMADRREESGDVTGGIVLPGQGRRLVAGPDWGPMVKVGPHNGSRLIGVLESELPVGGAQAPHVHDEYEEAFYVLAGEIDYLLDDHWTSGAVGTTFFVPQGRVHAFRNRSGQPARHLAISGPAVAMTLIEEFLNAAPDERAAVLAKYRSRLAD